MTKIKANFMGRFEVGMRDVFLLSLIFMMLLGPCLCAEELRPVRDDVGFCWKKKQVDRLLDYLKSSAQGQGKTNSDLPALIAGISPHDDYLYAGRVYYPLFKNVKTKEVVIFGVTHGTVRKAINDPQNVLIFDDYKYWRGPYSNVEVSGLREFLKNNLDPKFYMVNNEAHRLEHSIEASIPFLQHFNRDIKITPIMVTAMNFSRMVKVSDELATHISAYIKQDNLKLGEDIFFLVSSDANHYGKDFDNIVFGEDERAHQLGTGSDKRVANAFLSGKISKAKIAELTAKLWGKTHADYGDRVWCGKFSIPFGMLTLRKVVQHSQAGMSLMGKVLIYSDTYSEGVLPLKKPGYGITAPFSLKHWVGFLSAAFYLE